jgi:hypothetical protein
MNKHAFAICVLACAGCAFSDGSKQDEAQSLAFQNERKTVFFAALRADHEAGRQDGVMASATVIYWMGLKAALHPAPIDSDVAAKTIVKLSTRDVDPDLVREGQLVAEKMRAAADSIGSMPVVTILFRVPLSRWLEAEALSKAAIDQCRVVEGMRPELKARYGVEFPSFEILNHEASSAAKTPNGL